MKLKLSLRVFCALALAVTAAACSKRSPTRPTRGLLAKPKTFNVGPEVVIQTPSLSNPQNNAVSNGSSPTLSTNNATRTGPAGAITYKFDVSDSSTFTNIIYTGTIAEQSGGS